MGSCNHINEPKRDYVMMVSVLVRVQPPARVVHGDGRPAEDQWTGQHPPAGVQVKPEPYQGIGFALLYLSK